MQTLTSAGRGASMPWSSWRASLLSGALAGRFVPRRRRNRLLLAKIRLGQVLYLTFACLRLPDLPDGHSFSPSSSAQLRVPLLKRYWRRISARSCFFVLPRAHNHLQALVFYYLLLVALVAWTRLDLLVFSISGRRIRGLALKS
jgi:hypothetical protein